MRGCHRFPTGNPKREFHRGRRTKAAQLMSEAPRHAAQQRKARFARGFFMKDHANLDGASAMRGGSPPPLAPLGEKVFKGHRLKLVYPPAQKATGVNPWMNVRWVPSVALAPVLRNRSDCFGGVGKEGALRPSPSEVGYGRRSSEGSARRRVWRGATAVRPWGSTKITTALLLTKTAEL